MSTCEKCWTDAAIRVLRGGTFESHEAVYRHLLEERRHNPCTPEQQRHNQRTPSSPKTERADVDTD